MNEINGLVRDIAQALIDDGEALKKLDNFTPGELRVLSESLLALSQTTEHLAEVVRLLNR